MAEPTRDEEKPLHGSPIEDYCMIGDCETGALVSREGSIDWLCWPNFSSGACFAASAGDSGSRLLEDCACGKIKAIRRRYQQRTLVVETTFETKEGEVQLVDFMPPRAEHSHVVRMVRGVRGKVAMQMDLSIRFDYGRTIPWVTARITVCARLRDRTWWYCARRLHCVARGCRLGASSRCGLERW